MLNKIRRDVPTEPIRKIKLYKNTPKCLVYNQNHVIVIAPFCGNRVHTERLAPDNNSATTPPFYISGIRNRLLRWTNICP